MHFDFGGWDRAFNGRRVSIFAPNSFSIRMQLQLSDEAAAARANYLAATRRAAFEHQHHGQHQGSGRQSAGSTMQSGWNEAKSKEGRVSSDAMELCSPLPATKRSYPISAASRETVRHGNGDPSSELLMLQGQPQPSSASIVAWYVPSSNHDFAGHDYTNSEGFVDQSMLIDPNSVEWLCAIRESYFSQIQ